MFLNIKSEYNLQESTVRLEKLKDKLTSFNQKHFAICDYQTNQGFLKVANTFKNTDIKPVYGVEIMLDKQTFHLYAMNNDGLVRINQIVHDLNHNIPVSELEFGRNIQVVIGKGEIIDSVIKHDDLVRLDKLKEVYGLNLSLGLFSYLNDASNYQLFNANHLFGLKQVIIDAVKYLDYEDIDGYMTLQAIKYQQNFMHFSSLKKKAERYIIRTEYNEVLNEVIEYTNELLETCNANPLELKLEYPKYKFHDQASATEFFIEQIKKGIKWRFKNNFNPEYNDRLQYEINVIEQMGFVDYFLIVQDIVIFAKKNKIVVGPGRGSAAGSLVAYVLGITDIDPIKYNLYFERFLNPKRQTMPDIDIDFEASKRETVIDYIINRFGNEHVCKIGTVNRYLAKSAFNAAAVVWRVDVKLAQRISKMLNSSLSIEQNLNTNIKLNNEVERDLILRNVFRIAKIIEGLPSEYSIHAAGIIIADESIRDTCATRENGASILEAKELESIGLLKIDILALENLSFIRDLTQKIKVRDELFNLENIDLNDQKTFELLKTGNTLGIFQMESVGMREVLTKVKPSSFDELAIVLALYRPGAKDEVDNYVKARGNFIAKNKIDAILKDTYGILLYQEQVLLLAQELAGYTLADADIFRRAIAKKDEKLLKEEISKFIQACIKNSIDQELAMHYGDLIAKFAGYGFNKAHAYAYGMITYQLAYLKANYNEVFNESLFMKYQRSPELRRLQSEFGSSGIRIFSPDFRYSGVNVRIIKNQMLIGFNQIKGIDFEIAKKLAFGKKHLKDLKNIEEIINFIKILELNKEQIVSLVYSGCFDYLGYNQATLISNFVNAHNNENSVAKLFGDSFLTDEKADDSMLTKSTNEKNALGFNIKYNIFDQERQVLQKEYNQRIFSINEAFMYHNRNKNIVEYIVLIKIEAVKEITTKQNEKMAFISCESDGDYEMTCFPKTYQNVIDKIEIKPNTYQLALVKIQNDKVYLQKI